MNNGPEIAIDCDVNFKEEIAHETCAWSRKNMLAHKWNQGVPIHKLELSESNSVMVVQTSYIIVYSITNKIIKYTHLPNIHV